jgi:hypothetical protein
VKIELLYFEDCPSWQTALDNLKSVLSALGQPDEVRLVRVETDERAQAARFVGSPTIRADGDDLFPVPHEDYALGCRVYMTPEGMRGWPTETMLRAALEDRLG